MRVAKRWYPLHHRQQRINLLIVITALTLQPVATSAQVIPDGTLGAERSLVKSNILINGTSSDRIDGGALRGANLFHSFQEFNVAEGRGVYFTNPNGIENILTRVTGSNPSTIQGALGVLGPANLFLINPQGMIFGPNASLDLNGSFLGSTASSVTFADSSQFTTSDPQPQPLLTVSLPVGLQFGASAGSILNQSRTTDNNGRVVGLQVRPGQSLALVGNGVTLDGGVLRAPGGRVNVASVAASSSVGLEVAPQGLVLTPQPGENLQDLQLLNSARISTTGAVGGSIQLTGQQVRLDSSSLLLSVTFGSENGGDITIDADKFIVDDGSQVITSTAGSGQGGKLTINALNSVEVKGTSFFGVNSGLFSGTSSEGNAGEIVINTKKLLVQDQGIISTASDKTGFIPATGRGGNLTVNASESIELSNKGTLRSGTQGLGNGGTLTVNTGNLVVQTGASIEAITLGQGNAGSVLINALDSVFLSNPGSGVFASTTEQATGKGGELTLKVGKLLKITDGAEISVSSLGSGDAGSIFIDPALVELDSSAITARTASGRGGNINLQGGSLQLRNNSAISTTAEGGLGNGGNINFDVDTLVALENSDITANAFGGPGGNINIVTEGLFGTEFRESLTPQSDITASSEFGLSGVVEVNTPDVDPSQGLVELPTEVVDISGLIAQGCNSRGQTTAGESSRFVVTGRGGLPPNPGEALSSDTVLVDLGAPVAAKSSTMQKVDASAPATSSNRSITSPLVEAQGWVVASNGKVMLTAQAKHVTPSSPWLPATTCHAP